MAKNTKEYEDRGKRRVPGSKFKCEKCGSKNIEKQSQ